jgi:hypothetical protein
MRLVTGGDGKIGYISHARARSGDNLFWRHYVSQIAGRRDGRGYRGMSFSSHYSSLD